MSRQALTANRGPTLTEELERLEQSITLTLQEIDHNFSKAHRIVTSSIIPIVEQYAINSQDVWEGSKFWKQFFEASANVSLSGYEEPVPDDTVVDATSELDHTGNDTHGSIGNDHGRAREQGHEEAYPVEDDSSFLMDSPSNATGNHSTPRAPSSTQKIYKSPPPASTASQHARLPQRLRQHPEGPSTPLRQRSGNGFSSPFEPTSGGQSTAVRAQKHDPLLHRVLDKTYRVQATPHTARKARAAAADVRPSPKVTRTLALDSSPMSSPAMAPPQLRSDLFSPAPRSAQRPRAPRTPGTTAHSPATRYTSTGRAITRPAQAATVQERMVQGTPALWDSDDEDSAGFDMSPPKTLQFSVGPSRLMATPAREASRRIVADLLSEAGVGDDEESEELEAPSPTVVQGLAEDDTF